jgi:hypothetical protein
VHVVVVAGALGGIVQHIVGLGDRIEVVRGASVVAGVGVVLAREAPVCPADLVCARILGHAKHPVVVATKIDAPLVRQRRVLSRSRHELSTVAAPDSLRAASRTDATRTAGGRRSPVRERPGVTAPSLAGPA